MLELFVVGTLALAGLAVLGALGAVIALVAWLVMLPLQVIGWVVRGALGLAFGLALFPVLAVCGLLMLGAGVAMLLVPIAPLAALAILIWWLVRRGRRRTTSSPI